MNVDLSAAFISPAQRRYLPKDQAKATFATSMMASLGSNGATGQYMHLCLAAGCRVNDPQPNDIIFISANGSRSGAKPPPLTLISLASTLPNISFVTDARSRRPEGGNPYNTGEQLVAQHLRTLGYIETPGPHPDTCHWIKP